MCVGERKRMSLPIYVLHWNSENSTVCRHWAREAGSQGTPEKCFQPAFLSLRFYQAETSSVGLPETVSFTKLQSCGSGFRLPLTCRLHCPDCSFSSCLAIKLLFTPQDPTPTPPPPRSPPSTIQPKCLPLLPLLQLGKMFIGLLPQAPPQDGRTNLCVR